MRWVGLVEAPTLLVQGDQDRLVRVQSARAVASLRPDWEYHEFAGAGHVPMMEVPAEFLAVTGDWLARHAGDAGQAVPAGDEVDLVATPAVRPVRG
jgi:pimeloyl-ACP methyl ester carboxylesterase